MTDYMYTYLNRKDGKRKEGIKEGRKVRGQLVVFRCLILSLSLCLSLAVVGPLSLHKHARSVWAADRQMHGRDVLTCSES